MGLYKESKKKVGFKGESSRAFKGERGEDPPRGFMKRVESDLATMKDILHNITCLFLEILPLVLLLL